jgi:hypothetical protein
MHDFISGFREDRLFEVVRALAQLLEAVYLDTESGVPIEFQTRLIENYQPG